jgi:hypothetical protein
VELNEIAKSFKEISEEEIESTLISSSFGKDDIEHDPKVGDKKADFLIESIDLYVEVHAIKDIALNQLKIIEKKEKVMLFELKDEGKQEGQHKILDRIANKLHECTQLPDDKKNLIVTKTEGFLSPLTMLSMLLLVLPSYL